MLRNFTHKTIFIRLDEEEKKTRDKKIKLTNGIKTITIEKPSKKSTVIINPLAPLPYIQPKTKKLIKGYDDEGDSYTQDSSYEETRPFRRI
jgi:hypothetical protein